MTRWTVLLWWPFVGLLAMVLLGVAVGGRSTRLDDWVLGIAKTHAYLGRLLFFTDPRVLFAILACTVLAALYRRRWRFAAVAVAAPSVAVVSARVLKRVFDRHRGTSLAYPSGHVTTTVVVTGMAILVAGATVWALYAAVAFDVLGLLGQAATHHYFTDTVGAVFLGTALLGLAAWAARVDRCQPWCDLGHSSG